MITTGKQFEELSKRIIGAAIEVHKTLGPGFIESLYHNAMKKELSLLNIPFETEKEIKIQYKNENIGIHRIDLVVDNEFIVELKAVEGIVDVHIAQVISYMKASGIEKSLILNYAKPSIDIRRNDLKDYLRYKSKTEKNIKT